MVKKMFPDSPGSNLAAAFARQNEDRAEAQASADFDAWLVDFDLRLDALTARQEVLLAKLGVSTAKAEQTQAPMFNPRTTPMASP